MSKLRISSARTWIGLGFVSSTKKAYILKAILAIDLPLLLLLLLQPVEAAGKTPILNYGIIRKNNNAPPSISTHPPPVNDHPTRACNTQNLCRHFTLSVENPGGTRVEASALVEMGAPFNRSEPGTEAIAAGIAAWSLNKTKTNGNAYGRLSVSMDPIAGAGSAQMVQLEAVSRAIARAGLDVEYRSASMSTEDVASLPPADGFITITVDDYNLVELQFFAHAQSLGEADIMHILEYAKTMLQTIQN